MKVTPFGQKMALLIALDNFTHEPKTTYRGYRHRDVLQDHPSNKLVSPSEFGEVFHIHPSWRSASVVKAHGFLMVLRIRIFPLKSLALFLPCCFNTTAVVLK